MKSIVNVYLKLGIVPLIIIALILGIFIGGVIPSVGLKLGILGSLFVGALKAVAPVLVFILVMSAIASYI